MRDSELLNEKAIELARRHDAGDWATHVAVRNNLSRTESCVFDSAAKEFVDEDISLLDRGEWVGSYKETYWTFFALDNLFQ